MGYELTIDAQRAAVRDAIGLQTANALVPLMRLLNEGINNVCILECSDSTDYGANATGADYCGQKFVKWLQAQYASVYKAQFYTKSSGSSTWTGPTAVGDTGQAKSIYYYNAAIPSTNGYYLMGQWFENIFGLQSQSAPSPALIIFNHGKNNDYTQQESVHVAMYMAQMQMLALRWPNAGMLAYVQVPNLSDNQMDIKARALRIAAGHMGVTVVDHYGDFLDYVTAGGQRSDLLIDTIHPNQTGDDRRFERLKQLVRGPTGQFSPIRCSLADRVPNLLLNGDFSAYTTSSFDNWTGTNCTQTQETTNFETGSQAASLSNTTTGAGFIAQSLTGNAVKRHLGKFMTLAARVRVPSSGYVQDSGIGVIQLSNGVDNFRCWGYMQDANGGSKDGYMWIAVSGLIRTTTTTITATLYATNSNVSAGKTAVFDRAILTTGNFPRDML